ncbi:MAG: ATP-dependent sacrificial sulfur transferase LarE [Sporomusaceae bacterium]|nr:ATP-dependent sacrificial sulfur transferase LarE [Sporomusaceae bacterium]
MAAIHDKLQKLNNLLAEMGSAVVGFSGGVDSSFLAAAAHRALGDRAVAVTCYSPTLPQSEREEAAEVARWIGIRHVLLPQNELDSAEFVRNDADRCYYCKKGRFTALAAWAAAEGFRWVLEGANADDCGDYRPGMKAVAELAAVRSPLLEVGLTKDEIRDLSRQWRLPTWNKPAAACLSSRVAYGQPVTEAKLGQIEKAEAVLKKIFTGPVRVRHHGELARIEVSLEEMARIADPSTAKEIDAYLKALGFTYVAVDLAGYRTGSMNQVLDQEIIKKSQEVTTNG